MNRAQFGDNLRSNQSSARRFISRQKPAIPLTQLPIGSTSVFIRLAGLFDARDGDVNVTLVKSPSKRDL